MPRTNDEHPLGDIEGRYLLALRWPEQHPEFDVHRHLDEFVGRIRSKLAENPGLIRHNWFTIALGYALEAQAHYRAERVEMGRRALRTAWEHLESGVRTSRRKSAYIANPRRKPRREW